MEYCFRTGKQFWEYVEEYEGAGIWDYLKEVRRVMYAAIERGLNTEGVIPGGLGVSRKASTYLKRGDFLLTAVIWQHITTHSGIRGAGHGSGAPP